MVLNAFKRWNGGKQLLSKTLYRKVWIIFGRKCDRPTHLEKWIRLGWFQPSDSGKKGRNIQRVSRRLVRCWQWLVYWSTFLGFWWEILKEAHESALGVAVLEGWIDSKPTAPNTSKRELLQKSISHCLGIITLVINTSSTSGNMACDQFVRWTSQHVTQAAIKTLDRRFQPRKWRYRTPWQWWNNSLLNAQLGEWMVNGSLLLRANLNAMLISDVTKDVFS